jgi:photosystem II stability/assembly factor-like uncharacterized protein
MKVDLLLIATGLWLSFCSPSSAEIWIQTNWSGWPWHEEWTDTSTTSYLSREGVNGKFIPGELHLAYWRDTGFDALEWDVYIIYELFESYEGIMFAATGPYEGDVFRSWDYGETWENTEDIPDAPCVYDLIQASDRTLYAAVPVGSGGSAYGTVYRSTNWGNDWEPTADLGGWWIPLDLLEGLDGSIYASVVQDKGGVRDGCVLKTTNKGGSWNHTGSLPDEVEHVRPLLEDLQGSIYVAALLRIEGGECMPLGSDLWFLRPGMEGWLHQVFKSTDGGGRWQATGDLPEEVGWVPCLLQSSDSTIYGGTCSPVLIRSSDWGAAWDTTGPIEEPGLGVSSLLEASDGSLYAGWARANGGNIFRSPDGGNHWSKVSDLWGDLIAQVQDVDCLCEDRWGRIWAGTQPNAHILRGEYVDGYLVSSVYDAGSEPVYGAIRWEADLSGQSLSFRVRTDTAKGMETAMDWELCPLCTNGGDLSGLASVHDGDRYVQYRVEMFTLDPDVTPVVYQVSIEYKSMGGAEEMGRGCQRRLMGSWHPNPFSGSTLLGWSGHDAGVRIYDLSGRLVRVLVPEEDRVVWDGKDRSGRALANGVYLYVLADGARSGKLVLLR